VKSLFHMADFIAVQRDANRDWQGILAGVRRAFGEAPEDAKQDVAEAAAEQHAAFGEVQVEVQMFRDIPMLVKVSAGTEVLRQALPERFAAAVNRAAPSSQNMLAERRWVNQGARYGELEPIAREVAEEIAAAYDEQRVDQLVRKAFDRAPASEPRTPAVPVARLPEDPDWRVRYAGLERIGPRPDAIPVFAKALRDPHSAIRRLAAV